MTEMRERAGCLGGVEVPSNGKVVYGQTLRNEVMTIGAIGRPKPSQAPAYASAERHLSDQPANEIPVRSDAGLPLDGVGKTWELK